ncbi:hypothetical protein J2S74_002720 [Evansella vedderi]|uniref:Transmembrane protein n=1 Tax=Evansella vedderi TaxID=38282 RepID=A0ABT9ZXX8_9BACI|nr:hypothetical protein [Evansella vedderi]MDQ0255338.1 hypothetical protein [Evansella vedderi]
MLKMTEMEKTGWELPRVYGAFSNGSLPPSNHPYTITTSIVMDKCNVIPQLVIKEFEKTHMKFWWLLVCIGAKVYRVVTRMVFFWYSTNKADNYFVPNLSAMFLVNLSTLLNEQSNIFNNNQIKLI